MDAAPDIWADFLQAHASIVDRLGRELFDAVGPPRIRTADGGTRRP